MFVKSEEEARKKADDPGPMQKLMEVYKIDYDWEEQLSAPRSFTY